MTQKLFTSNFVLLILGQITSLFGNFILKLALSMYVLDMTGSAAVFAGILSVATIPTILLTPFGGILADRVNRRNLMVALDAVSGVSVLVATFLLSGRNAIAVISVLLVHGEIYCHYYFALWNAGDHQYFFHFCSFPDTAENTQSFHRESHGVCIYDYPVRPACGTGSVWFLV